MPHAIHCTRLPAWRLPGIPTHRLICPLRPDVHQVVVHNLVWQSASLLLLVTQSVKTANNIVAPCTSGKYTTNASRSASAVIPADLDKSADIQAIVADVQENSNMVLGLATLSCSNDYVKE
jgi:hypothetical protein